MAIEYPTRCVIVDADGGEFCGLPTRTPDASKPHVGKHGTAELILTDDAFPFDEQVRITLDDGVVIWGHECWWKPVDI